MHTPVWLALLFGCTPRYDTQDVGASTWVTTVAWSVWAGEVPSPVCADGAPVTVSLREGADTVLASTSVPCGEGTFVWSTGQGYAGLEINDVAWGGVSILEFASVEDGTATLVIDLGADGDGVDEDDRCPTDFDPGQEDADGDSLGDLCDPCPDEAGENGDGCPPAIEDRDSDGVADDDDDCPDEAGVEALDGCPDRDGDGFADAADACPDDAGPDSVDGALPLCTPETGLGSTWAGLFGRTRKNVPMAMPASSSAMTIRRSVLPPPSATSTSSMSAGVKT